MECQQCGRRVEPGDRFCTGCGISLQDVTDTTQVTSAIDGDADHVEIDDSATDAPDAPDADEVASEPPEGDRTALIPVIDEGGTARSDGEAPPSSPVVTDDRTELIPVVDEPDEWDAEPTWAPTGAVPQTPQTAPTTGDLPETEPITEVWMAKVDDDTGPPAVTPYDFASREPVTGHVATQPTTTAQMPTVAVIAQSPTAPPPGNRFGFGLITLIALVASAVALFALFAEVLSITSDVRLVIGPNTPEGFRTGSWILDDFADNLSIAGLIAVVLMVVGGLASGFHWRWGSGLAGGAGFAMAGIAAVAVGLAQMPIDDAHTFAAIPSDAPFVLTITRDLGYWLLVAAGALGVVLFFASINEAFGDRRAGLNPWIAALGALAVVVAVAGPLLPEEQAVFSDNWYLVEGPGEAPALLLLGRMVQLGLLLFGGVLGFLSVRRWGLGVAAGVSLPVVWLTVSVLFDLTDRPVGPGFRNPGATDMHLHGVTTIGVSAVFAMIVLGAIAAYDQGIRERR